MVLDIWEEILRNDPAPWVRQHYLDRFKAYVEGASFGWNQEKTARVLNQMPEGEALLRKWAAKPKMDWHLERLDIHLRPELRATKLKAN
jgi:hypothetical protein